MSHTRVKTKYYTMGAYGSVDEKILYADLDNSCDMITYYDEQGRIILVVEDTQDNNILDAINRLYAPFRDNKLDDNIEYASRDEMCKG